MVSKMTSPLILSLLIIITVLSLLAHVPNLRSMEDRTTVASCLAHDNSIHDLISAVGTDGVGDLHIHLSKAPREHLKDRLNDCLASAVAAAWQQQRQTPSEARLGNGHRLA